MCEAAFRKIGEDRGAKFDALDIFGPPKTGTPERYSFSAITFRIEDGRLLFKEAGHKTDTSLPLKFIDPKSIKPFNILKIPGVPLVKKGRAYGIITMGNDVKVLMAPDSLENREKGYAKHATTILRPGDVQNYDGSNRGIHNGFYPKEMNNIDELRNSVVVDFGTGGSKAVAEWREKKLIAFGVEIALSKKQRDLIYSYPVTERVPADGLDLRAPHSKGYFIQADLVHTGIKANSVDFIYATYTIFTYDFHKNPNLVEQVLKEAERILVQGGRLRISPLFLQKSEEEYFRKVVAKIPQLQILHYGPYSQGSDGDYCEIIKTNIR
ncbi:MAG: hypothetical protein JWQ35_1586 [Bacteriovoracaceae bacterium]|nr:hypothetical protein [Bacteriovoracaceae bacterium]